MAKTVISPDYLEPHYSTRLWRAHHQYLAKFHDKEIFAEACAALGMPLDFILRDDNWVSNKFLQDYKSLIIERTSDPDIYEKFGGFSVSPEVVNPVEYAVASTILFPYLFYFGMAKQYSRYNNINDLKLIESRPGHFEYAITPKGETRADPDVCRNTIGMLGATERLFGLDRCAVTHPECIHQGAPACRFVVKYGAQTFWKGRLKAVAVAASGAAGLMAIARRPAETLIIYALAIALSVIVKRYLHILRYIQQYNEQSRQKAAELHRSYQKLEFRYQESNLLRELSVKLAATTNTQEVLQSCLDDLDRRFGYSRAVVLLLSSKQDNLYVAEVRGFADGPAGKDRIYRLSLKYPAEKDSPALFANILEAGKTTSVFDVAAYGTQLKPANRALIEQLGVNALIVAPIQDSDQKYGLLVVGSAGQDRKLTRDDEHMIQNVSNLLSLFFRNARNFEREKSLRGVFQKYVPAIVLDGLKELAPKTQEISSLFVDLRDFTSRCERLQPESIIQMISLYADYVTARIAAAGGIIDKLVGDGLNAFFPGEQHAASALRAAVAILADLDELDREFVARGFGSVGLGIGLHSGRATVGAMGCDLKSDYSAVGDTVNTASRLQTASKEHRLRTPSARRGILVFSGTTLAAARLPELLAESIGETAIRGRSEKEVLYFIDVELAIRQRGALGETVQGLGSSATASQPKSLKTA